MRAIILSLALVLFISFSASAGEVIRKFSGSETATMGPIEVPDNWEIQWETKGQYLQILLNSANSVPLDMILQQMGPGEGVVKQEKGGSYIFDFNASGPWEVKIQKSE